MCAVYVSSELGEVQIVLCMYHLNTSEVQIVCVCCAYII